MSPIGAVSSISIRPASCSSCAIRHGTGSLQPGSSRSGASPSRHPNRRPLMVRKTMTACSLICTNTSPTFGGNRNREPPTHGQCPQTRSAPPRRPGRRQMVKNGSGSLFQSGPLRTTRQPVLPIPFEGNSNELGPYPDAGLFEEPLENPFHRAFRYLHFVSDLPIREAVKEPGQHGARENSGNLVAGASRLPRRLLLQLIPVLPYCRARSRRARLCGSRSRVQRKGYAS